MNGKIYTNGQLPCPKLSLLLNLFTITDTTMETSTSSKSDRTVLFQCLSSMASIDTAASLEALMHDKVAQHLLRVIPGRSVIDVILCLFTGRDPGQVPHCGPLFSQQSRFRPGSKLVRPRIALGSQRNKNQDLPPTWPPHCYIMSLQFPVATTQPRGLQGNGRLTTASTCVYTDMFWHGTARENFSSSFHISYGKWTQGGYNLQQYG